MSNRRLEERGDTQPYVWLRAQILNGNQPAGTHLAVRPIAQMLLVSVTPVREALIRLQAEGLVDELPGLGFFVHQPTLGDFHDGAQLLEGLLRLILERASDVPPAPLEARDDPPRDRLDAVQLYKAVGACHGTPLQRHYLGNLVDRLHALFRSEARLAHGDENFLADCWQAFDARDIPALRRALRRLHMRRYRRLPTGLLDVPAREA